MSLRKVHSQKRHEHVVFDGYQFQQDKETTFVTYWRCNLGRSTIKCPGRIRTSEGKVIFNNDRHNHTPNIARIEAKQCMHVIKEKARLSMETSAQIISSLNVKDSEYIFCVFFNSSDDTLISYSNFFICFLCTS